MVKQVKAGEHDGPRTLLATKTSCQEKFHRPSVIDPLQLLFTTVLPQKGAEK